MFYNQKPVIFPYLLSVFLCNFGLMIDQVYIYKKSALHNCNRQNVILMLDRNFVLRLPLEVYRSQYTK